MTEHNKETMFDDGHTYKDIPANESGESIDPAIVRVADICPFWRWAVGPTSQHSPAIPYHTRASAEAFFEEVKRGLPWAGVRLYRRRWFRRIEVVKGHVPLMRN